MKCIACARVSTVALRSVETVLMALTILNGPSQAAELTGTWSQWHGPNRDCGVGGPAWPTSLGRDHLQLLWHVDLGPGYPGPIVAADRVFVAETNDRKTEIVRALDRQTGRELWKAEWPGAMTVPFMAKRNGDWIRSTPAYDGESIYVAGMRDVLVCLKVQSGKERWRVDFVEQIKTPLPDFGFVCSPLVIGDHVYVQAGAGLCKLDKHTGKILWRVLTDAGGMFGSAFSSPILAKLCGKQQLVVQTRMKLAGVEPDSGKVLWSEPIPAMLGMNIVTPTVLGDRIFTSSYGGGSRLLEIKVRGQDFQVLTVWQTPLQGYMSTPVLIDSHAYLHLRSQRFTCLDLATGKQKWTTSPYGQYWSLVAQKDRILALDQRGELLLIHATPEKFDLLDSRKVSDQETWGHLAVCGDEVFIRELNGISAYRWR
jgi:outer membrane protein assembly factor BamB